MRKTTPFFIAILLLSTFSSAFSIGSAGGDLGATLPIWSVIPFVGILLSIAIFPLVAEKFWHHHFGKISAFWAVLLAVPFIYAHGGAAIHEILHEIFLGYVPFIILLWSLYTISGGILVKGAPIGVPRNNLIILIIGTALASWVGTTGAAMVLIRPYLRMNQYRKSKIHLIIFFIFLVANIGGSLTPLGDPPLFLGFLQGVEFFWTFKLLPQMLFLSGILFAIFFAWDTYMFRKEGWHKKTNLLHQQMDAQADEGNNETEDQASQNPGTKDSGMTVKGTFNFIFLAGVVGGVLFSGQAHLGEFTFLGVHMEWQNVVRDVFLIVMGLLSLKFTPLAYREANEFNWFPIQEVAKLFAGIFITIVPALVILRAGEQGALKFIIDAVEAPAHYFWITGSLSSFLDNAPTYLVFFNTALGKFSQTVSWLMADGGIYLLAISCGAVFFGAVTYIGNAPNFMVKSIAEQAGIKMPSFFGYMVYSVLILVPIFVLITYVFY